MRLKSLKLAGFKSFANPTTFSFKHDITAIVGPNGCGKSNVIDAIRWVLGETSAKQLRGGAMSDVIFAGVEGRAGKSLASVELTFEHTQDESTGIRHALNLYHELTLRRQVSKEGKSDYFINGQKVRRRDVVDVFLGTGLGARSYAVIEQGMIGRIVESSPLELRAFIEEAAGVSRYQARRSETQKQLTCAKDNLERLYDVQSELKKQHKILSRQAHAAQKYQALRDELLALDKDRLLEQIFAVWQLLAQKNSEQQQTSQRLLVLQKSVQLSQKALATLADKLAQTQWLKDDAQDKYHQACLNEQAAQHSVLQVKQQLEQCAQKLATLSATEQQAKAKMVQVRAELGDIDGELTIMAPKLQQLQDDKQRHQDDLSATKSKYQQISQELETLIAQKQTLTHQQKSAERQIERLCLAQEKWTKKHAALMAEQGNFEHIEEDKIACQKLQVRIQELQERLADLEQCQDQQTQFAKTQAQAHALKEHITSLEKRHAVLMGEYETIHKLLHKSPAPTPDVSSQDDAIIMLKEQIGLSSIGQQFAGVLDEFLGFWLDARLVDVLPYQQLGHGAKSTKAILLTSDLSVMDKHSQQLLPLNTLLSPALVAFERVYLWQMDKPSIQDCQCVQPVIDKGAVILTTTGWLLGQFGMVHVSKFGEKSDFLSQKIEHRQRLDELEVLLNELEQQLDDKNQALKVANRQLETLKIAFQERQAQSSAISTDLRQSEQKYARLQAQLGQHAIRQANHIKNALALEEAQAEIHHELQQQRQELTDAQQALERCLPRLTKSELAATTIASLIQQSSAKLQALNDDHQHWCLRQNTLNQNKIHAQQMLAMAQNNMAQAVAAGKELHSQQAQLSDKLPKAEEALAQAKQRVAHLKLQHEAHEASIKLLQQTQQEQQHELDSNQTLLLAQQAQSAQLGADISVAQSRLQDLDAKMLAMDKQFVLSSVLAQFRQSPPVFVDNQARYQTVKEELDKLGAVNMVAAAELGELEERLSSMQQQISDIIQSIEKLQDAIKTIDNKTKTLFLTMLNAVNAELNALFTKVFAGGQASLSLINDDSLPKADKWRAGLVLMAQPKGKKNSRLAVLSGGEKTLTALSLIFAIFKQHPAPFCVLDEVDAPLDDANVARFTNLIGELSSSVQFIFISHNKLAMKIAHELKGITMPTAGISSLVTVNLAQAEQYLEPNV